MNLETHYRQLWQQSSQSFKQGLFELDPLLDASSDRRYGLTLLLRPAPHVLEKTQGFLADIRLLEPHQYYYPASDIHVTVMSIISCYEGFLLSSINLQDYTELVAEAVSVINPFTIHFKGITASPSCIMVQGFPAANSLNKFRDVIRETFKRSGLQQSMDRRYTIQTAHSTVIRFRRQVEQHERLLLKLEEYRDYHFGSSEIVQAELVYNDWYQRKGKVQVLQTFRF
ncbi:2'-5' RNA ligase family protein [Pontibacter sp. SGAir0037]|uniref:2'-5' RNA ligase family protein n=1 Tax=Pontibacter sp. SGAir0037 TaxID=2571030 RepID=UPI0010CD31CD|nr:2'-5' RNA ligase family protein [Pontibacter sp. SGAir0037]QCR22230.1 mutarotase [Pontibacter sp. SGAir0037]